MFLQLRHLFLAVKGTGGLGRFCSLPALTHKSPLFGSSLRLELVVLKLYPSLRTGQEPSLVTLELCTWLRSVITHTAVLVFGSWGVTNLATAEQLLASLDAVASQLVFAVYKPRGQKNKLHQSAKALHVSFLFRVKQRLLAIEPGC